MAVLESANSFDEAMYLAMGYSKSKEF